MDELQRQICQALNTFCFLKIWNEPTSEYRVNIKPILMDPRSRHGKITVNGSILSLPRETEPFFLFSISTDCFRNGIPIASGQWVNSIDMCNDCDVLMHVYTENGRMLSHKDTFLYWLPSESAYILAVSKAAFTAINVTPDRVSKIYVTVYKDSDIANKTTLYGYKVPTTDINGVYRSQIVATLQSLENPEQVIVYVNGYAVKLTDPATLRTNDFVDIVYDTNIITTFELDCTDNSNYWIYTSKRYQDNRLLIHMPKELNPENKVLTHNTCDFFVYRKKTIRFQEEGLYVQRTSERGIKQVTHQDFSMSEEVLNAYRDYLTLTENIPDSQAVKIKVIVRQHDKDNVLLRDKNYIDMLYSQSDELIVRCLKDVDRPKDAPEFWKASNLEDSVYVRMMFDVPDTITLDNMWYYIDGLGYYHVISLLCERVTSVKITDLYGGFLSWNKPYLFKDCKIFPLIYKNGMKIPQDYVRVHQKDNELYYSITFEDNYPIQLGDTISMELFIDGNRQVDEFTVTTNNRTIKVPYEDILIYQKIDNNPGRAEGIDFETHTSYKKLTIYPTNCTVVYENGVTTITFNEKHIGDTYIIQNKYCVRPVELTTELREKIANGDPLAFNLLCRTNNLEHLVPILEPQAVQVFLNGRYLINNLDYHIATIDTFGDISMHQLVIQNKSYLLGNDKDILEVFVTSADIEDTSFGFIKQDKIIHADSKVLALWFPGISSAHIEGYQELNLIDHSTYLSVPEGKYRQGAPYELSTNLPKLIKDFIDTYHENDDIEHMVAINNYFYGTKPDLEGIMILPYSHQLYSIFLQTIIRDIVDGTLKIAFDPDLPRMVNQTVSYNHLKKFDVLYTPTSPEVDTTYVDIFPTYTEWGEVDPETARIIHVLVKLLLPDDNFSNGEIPDVH